MYNIWQIVKAFNSQTLTLAKTKQLTCLKNKKENKWPRDIVANYLSPKSGVKFLACLQENAF